MRHRAGLSRQRSRLASSKLIVFSSSRRIPPPGWSAPARKSAPDQPPPQLGHDSMTANGSGVRILCDNVEIRRIRSGARTHRRRTRATPRPGTARAHGRAHATARQKRRVAVESARRRKGGACRPYGCGSSRADSAGVRTLSFVSEPQTRAQPQDTSATTTRKEKHPAIGLTIASTTTSPGRNSAAVTHFAPASYRSNSAPSSVK